MKFKSCAVRNHATQCTVEKQTVCMGVSESEGKRWERKDRAVIVVGKGREKVQWNVPVFKLSPIPSCIPVLEF